MDNIWEDDLESLMSKYNEGIHFSLCVIKVFSKYECFVLLRDKTAQGIGEKCIK